MSRPDSKKEYFSSALTAHVRQGSSCICPEPWFIVTALRFIILDPKREEKKERKYERGGGVGVIMLEEKRQNEAKACRRKQCFSSKHLDYL